LFLTLAQLFGFDAVTISGTIFDVSGNPLPGANVMLVNTSYGEAADPQGFYSITVPTGSVSDNSAVMRASFIGYRTTADTVSFSGQKDITIDFVLSQDVLGLEAVVVTGLGGLEEKKKLGVLIESVKPETAQKSGEINIITALRGNVPGLEIRKTSGDAGTNAYFRIRGTGTISGGHEPLIIVDGLPINSSTRTVGGNESVQSPRNRAEASSRTSDINIDDIASIEVLKGAAASAIYGSRASNGVILITTKSGKIGKMQITYKTQNGISGINKDYPLQNWFGQGAGGDTITNSAFSWGRPLNTSSAPWYNPRIKEDQTYDHLASISGLGVANEQSLIASGGNDKTTFYLSFGRTYEKSHWIDWKDYKDLVPTTYGHTPNRETPSDYTRYTIRLKGSHLIRENLTLSSSISYVKVNTNNIARAHTTDGIGRGLLATPPDFNLLPYLNPLTQHHRSSTNESPTAPQGPHSWNNPYWVLFEMMQKQELNRSYGNIKIDYKPIDWATISYNIGADYSFDKRLDVLPIGTYRNGGIGRMFRNLNNSLEWDANFIITLDGNKLLGRPTKLTMGHNLNSRSSNTIKNLGNEQIVLNYFQMENFSSQTITEYLSLIHTESVFAQISHDIWDEIYLTAALRQDGSSTFGPADRQHLFKKLSGAWNFTKRLNIPFVHYGKLRAAYGEAGEQPEVYSIYSGYVSDNIGYFENKVSLGKAGAYGGVLGYVSDSRLGNRAIRPEKRTENEIGLDLEFLDKGFGLSLTGYRAISNDVIFTMDVAPSTGSDTYTANGAIIENKGLEFSLNGNIIDKKGFKWASRFIYASNDNMLVEMNGITKESAQFLDPSNVPIDQLSKFTFVAPGHPIGEFRGYSWARFGYGIIATDRDEIGNTVSVNIDSVYAGIWERNDVYVQRDGYPDVNWQTSDGEAGGYLWSGYSPNPNWTGSLYNEIKISNNISISSLVDISSGGYVVNYTKNKLNEVGTHQETQERYHDLFDEPSWDGYEEGVSTEWGRGTFSRFLNNGHSAIGPGSETQINYDESFFTSTMGTATDIINNIESASYVKLRELSFSYRVNSNIIEKYGFSGADIRLSFRDLITISKYSGWDPETNMMQNRISGEDYFNQPQTWGANLSIYLRW
jgi:TonB-linked SusC/RagA family outer membrane protein